MFTIPPKMDSCMKDGSLTLVEAFSILKNYKYVVFDDVPSRLKLFREKRGLIVKVDDAVMLFPYEKNEIIDVGKDFICMNDVNGWRQVFYPLVNANLI